MKRGLLPLKGDGNIIKENFIQVMEEAEYCCQHYRAAMIMISANLGRVSSMPSTAFAYTVLTQSSQ